MKRFTAFVAVVIIIAACQPSSPKYEASVKDIKDRVEAYQSFRLTTDLSALSPSQKEMLPLLFEVADIMDNLFWQQAWGDKEQLLGNIKNNHLRRYAEINYGPWDRLRDNEPFIKGIGPKPAGSGFYPEDMSMNEFRQLSNHDKNSLYTVIERDREGDLIVVPYSRKWEEELSRASELLMRASEMAEDQGFKRYLKERAKAFLSNDYFKSDMAWMDMKKNIIDFVVGPIETYEDKLMGAKAAFEAYILIKDTVWSERLNRFAELLPQIQQALPVEPEYKSETPGSDSDLNVYDAVYYAGDCNAASKTIAINLPNDPDVQMKKGSRKLQLKNSMKAKFENILVPISKILIDPSQHQYIDFDAFFENTMFHEVAHGLGIKNTINGKGTVREALKETASAIEEGKADILGLYIVTHLAETGELKNKDLMTNYVTFMAGIFRSVRFGAASAHGKANMIRFNYFLEKEAFTRNPETGTYHVDFARMKEAMNQLSEEILVLQGNGDYEKAKKMVDQLGIINTRLQQDLDRINEAGIPVDIVFEQGPEILGL
ncbi:dipeptidyl-peptidase 3 family protein [Anaerophaga thermohalophila]|uniref:dipeptidyl-peptidase 3 family protein n=1 Tax=Anaerophaga thermohalophila TaxID=177400 RepID=UPI0002E7C51A|nr:peptidase M49 [Anaerophaga thermohalophila]